MLAGASRGAIRLQLELPVWQRWKTWSCSFHVQWSPHLRTGQKGFSSGVAGSSPTGQSQVANPSVALGVCFVAFTSVPSWLSPGGSCVSPRLNRLVRKTANHSNPVNISSHSFPTSCPSLCSMHMDIFSEAGCSVVGCKHLGFGVRFT